MSVLLGSSFISPLGSSGSSWTALPQKLIVTPDVYIEEMDATAGWSVLAGNGTFELNNIQKHSGTGSIKGISAVGGVTTIKKAVDLDFSLDGGKSFKLWVYPHTEVTGAINIYLLNSVGDFANFWQTGYNKDNLVPNQWNLLWNEWYTLNNLIWDVGAGNPTLSGIKEIYIRVFGVAGKVTEYSYDLITNGVVKKPACLINFDDGYNTDYTKAYPILKAKKMVATSYLVSDNDGVAGMLNHSQMQELYNNGWDLGNHTKTHPLTETFTQAEYEAEIETCRVYLEGLGFTRASKHIGYTGASYGAVALAAVKNWGAKTGRGLGHSSNLLESEGQYELKLDQWINPFPYNLGVLVPAYDSTLVSVTNYIDRALADGSVPILTFHKLVDGAPAAYETQVSRVQEIVDYLELKGFQSLTIDEYYRLYSGAITVHHK